MKPTHVTIKIERVDGSNETHVLCTASAMKKLLNDQGILGQLVRNDKPIEEIIHQSK